MREMQKDDLIKPFLRTTVDGLDITGDPSVDRLNIEGPFNQTGAGDTAARRKIFVCQPAVDKSGAKDDLPCARKILSTLAQRAVLRGRSGSTRWVVGAAVFAAVGGAVPAAVVAALFAALPGATSCTPTAGPRSARSSRRELSSPVRTGLA